VTTRILAIAAIAVVALVSVITLASANGGPAETIPNAQKAIEALPYDLMFTSPPRDTRKALIIRADGKQGRSFRFFLFVGSAPRNLGGPGYHRDHLEGGALGHSFVLLEDETHQTRPESLTPPGNPVQGHSKITAAQENEYYEILFAVEDAVCELSEGKPCPAL
jgi:hypothetical protein